MPLDSLRRPSLFECPPSIPPDAIACHIGEVTIHAARQQYPPTFPLHAVRLAAKDYDKKASPDWPADAPKNPSEAPPGGDNPSKTRPSKDRNKQDRH